MKLTPELLRDGCQWLARELTRLEQLNQPLSINDFFSWSSNEALLKPYLHGTESSLRGSIFLIMKANIIA